MLTPVGKNLIKSDKYEYSEMNTKHVENMG